MFSFMASYLLFWKTIWREKDMIHEKIKNKKMLKKRYYLQQKLESNFWPGKRWNLIFSISGKVVENWISFKKKTNPESIGILRRKLWPKYETSDEDNTNSTSSSTSFQNSNGDQHQICLSLSNRLIPSLSFRRKLFEK